MMMKKRGWKSDIRAGNNVSESRRYSVWPLVIPYFYSAKHIRYGVPFGYDIFFHEPVRMAVGGLPPFDYGWESCESGISSWAMASHLWLREPAYFSAFKQNARKTVIGIPFNYGLMWLP